MTLSSTCCRLGRPSTTAWIIPVSSQKGVGCGCTAGWAWSISMIWPHSFRMGNAMISYMYSDSGRRNLLFFLIQFTFNSDSNVLNSVIKLQPTLLYWGTHKWTNRVLRSCFWYGRGNETVRIRVYLIPDKRRLLGFLVFYLQYRRDPPRYFSMKIHCRCKKCHYHDNNTSAVRKEKKHKYCRWW